MSRITGYQIGSLFLPLRVLSNSPFVVTKVSGLSDLSLIHSETDADHIYTVGDGRDVAITLSMKPGADMYTARRLVAKALPINSDVTVTILINDESTHYAKTICRVRNVDSDFSAEMPVISIDLESIYTFLTLKDAVVITGLPFGLSAQFKDVTHDYTPVFVTLSLVSPIATYYKIEISSDWITINMAIIRVNYGIETVPEGSTIEINSDDEDFGVWLKQPGSDPINIETACELGPGGFKFMPNEPMLIKTFKMPSSLSGERIDLLCYPRISGV